jgi:radical SAM superfamily enzyme YgiQ (UPF0313 family)
MKNILFIVPPHLTYDNFIHPREYHAKVSVKKDGKTYGNIVTEIPLGCLALSAYAKQQCDVHTDIIDFSVVLNQHDDFLYDNFETFFQDHLKSINSVPDIICISTLFIAAYKSSVSIAKCCRELFPNSIIILGGGVPTNRYEQYFVDCDCIDAVCYGEGELPLAGLLMNNNFDHQSWITPDKLLRGISPVLSFVENLDNIPLCDYSIINLQDYSNPAMSSWSSADATNMHIHYMSSRGCIHNCTFCSSSTVHGHFMRQHTLHRVKSDFEYFKSIGIKTVIFQDDHVLYNKDRFKEMLCYMKDLELFPIFQNGMALYALDRDILQILKDMGTEQISLAIESGSEKVLKHIMHKPLNHKIITRVVNDCKEIGLCTNANIILGLPGENKQDIQDSIDFLKTLSVNWFIILNFYPLMGTKLYDICVKNKYISGEFDNGDYRHPVVNTEDFTADYIKKRMYEVNLELNFINNYDFKVKNYKVALQGFLNAIRARPDHALAHYYVAKCYEGLGQNESSALYMNKTKDILHSNDFWTAIFQQYNIIL